MSTFGGKSAELLYRSGNVFVFSSKAKDKEDWGMWQEAVGLMENVVLMFLSMNVVLPKNTTHTVAGSRSICYDLSQKQQPEKH